MADPVKQLRDSLKNVKDDSAPDQVRAAFIIAIDGLDLDQAKKNILVDRFQKQLKEALKDGTFSKSDVRHLKDEVLKDVDVAKDLKSPSQNAASVPVGPTPQPQPSQATIGKEMVSTKLTFDLNDRMARIRLGLDENGKLTNLAQAPDGELSERGPIGLKEFNKLKIGGQNVIGVDVLKNAKGDVVVYGFHNVNTPNSQIYVAPDSLPPDTRRTIDAAAQSGPKDELRRNYDYLLSTAEKNRDAFLGKLTPEQAEAYKKLNLENNPAMVRANPDYQSFFKSLSFDQKSAFTGVVQNYQAVSRLEVQHPRLKLGLSEEEYKARPVMDKPAATAVDPNAYQEWLRKMQGPAATPEKQAAFKAHMEDFRGKLTPDQQKLYVDPVNLGPDGATPPGLDKFEKSLSREQMVAWNKLAQEAGPAGEKFFARTDWARNFEARDKYVQSLQDFHKGLPPEVQKHWVNPAGPSVAHSFADKNSQQVFGVWKKEMEHFEGAIRESIRDSVRKDGAYLKDVDKSELNPKDPDALVKAEMRALEKRVAPLFEQKMKEWGRIRGEASRLGIDGTMPEFNKPVPDAKPAAPAGGAPATPQAGVAPVVPPPVDPAALDYFDKKFDKAAFQKVDAHFQKGMSAFYGKLSPEHKSLFEDPLHGLSGRDKDGMRIEVGMEIHAYRDSVARHKADLARFEKDVISKLSPEQQVEWEQLKKTAGKYGLHFDRPDDGIKSAPSAPYESPLKFTEMPKWLQDKDPPFDITVDEQRREFRRLIKEGRDFSGGPAEGGSGVVTVVAKAVEVETVKSVLPSTLNLESVQMARVIGLQGTNDGVKAMISDLSTATGHNGNIPDVEPGGEMYSGISGPVMQDPALRASTGMKLG